MIASVGCDIQVLYINCWSLFSMNECVFCNRNDAVVENELAYVLEDSFPVSPGHLLVVPRRHFASIFDATDEEKKAFDELLNEAKHILDERFSPDGFNIGINVGEHAGQSIFHVHIHLIPRYIGDVVNPKGGVRGVIPDKRIY